MNTSFLYHELGLKSLRYVGCERHKGRSIVKTESKHRMLCCPKCGGKRLIKNGTRTRVFHCVPIGRRPVSIRVRLQRYKCKECDYDAQEPIPFANGSCGYTHRFASYVLDLLRIGTIKDVAALLCVSWDTVNDIHKRHLKRKYSPPIIKGVKRIGIDEFAVRKGHVYMTIVVDLDTGRIVHVGNGKGKEALEAFWNRANRLGVEIEVVATDLSGAFIASVLENAPEATLVFDHFHVVKLMNDAVDSVRRTQYAVETDLNKRKIIKGSRWLLLQNGTDVMDSRHRNRLDNVLELNKPIAQAYFLKEYLREIWMQPNKAEAEKVIDDWVRIARDSGQKQLVKMAATLLAHRWGILAWCDHHISSGRVEGINNKIKVMKRNAYGFRDEEYFKLRLFSLHDCRITRNVG